MTCAICPNYRHCQMVASGCHLFACYERNFIPEELLKREKYYQKLLNHV